MTTLYDHLDHPSDGRRQYMETNEHSSQADADTAVAPAARNTERASVFAHKSYILPPVCALQQRFGRSLKSSSGSGDRRRESRVLGSVQHSKEEGVCICSWKQVGCAPPIQIRVWATVSYFETILAVLPGAAWCRCRDVFRIRKNNLKPSSSP